MSLMSWFIGIGGYSLFWNVLNFNGVVCVNIVLVLILVIISDL